MTSWNHIYQLVFAEERLVLEPLRSKLLVQNLK